MYAFRKPFTAATFEDGPDLLGLGFKDILVISQVCGYALSKFAGIKFVSEAKRSVRPWMILGLVCLSEIALLLFAVSPPQARLACLFMNGLPLGMVWGLVFSYLEGRRLTEIMGMMLCASFIFSSGLVKQIGQKLMFSGVGEYWMPALTGLIAAVPLVISVWLLDQVPEPSTADVEHRTKREPMSRADRIAVFRRLAFGVICLVAVYTLLTAYRDFRDNFMVNILNDVRGEKTEIEFGRIENLVSVSVLLSLVGLVAIKNNMTALIVNHVFVAFGLGAAGVATWLFQQELISDFWWMVITGYGAYVAYVPFNCILFDRLIAAFPSSQQRRFLHLCGRRIWIPGKRVMLGV